MRLTDADIEYIDETLDYLVEEYESLNDDYEELEDLTYVFLGDIEKYERLYLDAIHKHNEIEKDLKAKNAIIADLSYDLEDFQSSFKSLLPKSTLYSF